MSLKSFLIVGQFSLVTGFTGLIINIFYAGNNPALAFFVGVLLGLSLVMNVAYLVKERRRSS